MPLRRLNTVLGAPQIAIADVFLHALMVNINMMDPSVTLPTMYTLMVSTFLQLLHPSTRDIHGPSVSTNQDVGPHSIKDSDSITLFRRSP